MENSTNSSALNEDSDMREIVVTLRKNAEGNEVLHFDGTADDLDIDFVKTDQSGLRKLFSWLLDEQFKERAVLKLLKDPSVKNITYQKVAEDYINDLNAEIDSIFATEGEAIKDLAVDVDAIMAESETVG